MLPNAAVIPWFIMHGIILVVNICGLVWRRMNAYLLEECAFPVVQ